MRLQKIIHFSILGILLVTTNISYAAYTLNDAMNDAAKLSQKLLYNKQKFDTVQTRRDKILAEFWPTVGASAQIIKDERDGYTLDSGAPIQSRTVNANPYSISINQELYHGGRSLARLAQADKIIAASEQELYIDNAKTISEIIDSYYHLIYAKKVYEIRIKGEEGMKTRLEQILTRFNAGDTTRTDVSSAKASVAEATRLREQAFGEMKNAEAAFIFVVGKAPENELLEIPLEQMKISLPNTLEEYRNIALSKNLNIANAKNSLGAARQGIAIANAELLPTISASIQRSGNNKYEETNRLNGTTYSLNLSLPIFNTPAYADIKESKYRVRQSETAYQDTVNYVHQQVTSTWSSYQALLFQRKSSRESVHASQDALDGVVQEYQIGNKTTLDLLDREERLLEALIREADTAKKLVTSAFKIKEVMGELHNFDFKDL